MSVEKKPLVSVIIITYNSSQYVMETLESIKSQTWDNIELIVTDDCSKDNTVEICSAWLKENEKRFHKTQLITVPQNTGISANCNRGLQATSGEWIKTIAADDVLLDTCISDNLDYAQRVPEASFIVSDVVEIDENSNILAEQSVNEGLLFFSKITSVKKQLKEYSRWPAFLNTPSVFSKRDLAVVANNFDEEFRIYEDMAMVFRIISRGVKIHYLNKPTVKYRIHPNSISRSIKMDLVREKEAFGIFNKYQKKNLKIFNPLDLSVFYENWLRFKYKGTYGFKGISFLRKFSLFYWYMKLNGVKSY